MNNCRLLKMTTKEKIVIDLTTLGGRVYVGRPNGKQARKYFNLDNIETDNTYPVEILFPEDARTLTSSFFLGMFGDSVRKAGSKDAFLTRFNFKANERILKEVYKGIADALIAR